MKKSHSSTGQKKPGRPTKRTEHTLQILLEAAEAGAPVKACCAVAGIHPDTWQEWREADPDLQARFDTARERGRVAMLAVLKREASNDWRAAAEFLRLSFRSEYSAKAEICLEAGDGTRAALVIGPMELQALQSGYRDFRQTITNGEE